MLSSECRRPAQWFRLFHRAFLLNLAGMCFLLCSKVLGVADGFDSICSYGSHLVSPQTVIVRYLLLGQHDGAEFALYPAQTPHAGGRFTAGGAVALLYYLSPAIMAGLDLSCTAGWLRHGLLLFAMAGHLILAGVACAMGSWDNILLGVLALCNQPPYVTSPSFTTSFGFINTIESSTRPVLVGLMLHIIGGLRAPSATQR